MTAPAIPAGQVQAEPIEVLIFPPGGEVLEFPGKSLQRVSVAPGVMQIVVVDPAKPEEVLEFTGVPFCIRSRPMSVLVPAHGLNS